MYAYWYETKEDLEKDAWSDRFAVSTSSPFEDVAELVETAFKDYKTIDQEFMYFKVNDYVMKILPGEYALITKSKS